MALQASSEAMACMLGCRGRPGRRPGRRPGLRLSPLGVPRPPAEPFGGGVGGGAVCRGPGWAGNQQPSDLVLVRADALARI